MNEYEMMTVLHPRLNADETTAAVTALEEQIVTNGGEMLSTDNWGRRRLAYPIDGVVDGTYVLMTFNLPAEGAKPLERWIGISETAIRHLLIRGIIPFEGDRGRDRDDRDDRDDRYGRDDRDGDRDRGERRDDDERGSAGSGEPRTEAPRPAADATLAVEAADAPTEETSSEGASSEGSEEPTAEAADDTKPSEEEPSENESSENKD